MTWREPAPANDRAAPRRGRRGVVTDLRFLIGVVLVVCSIAGVWAVVTFSSHTVRVYAAAGAIVPGQHLEASDLVAVDVALGAASTAYLPADAVPRDTVATRAVASGELVPRAATGRAADSAFTSVVIRSSADVPGTVRAGSQVEVWAAAQTERGVFDTPRVLVADATVVAVDRDTSMMGSGAAEVELVIRRAEVADTLAAVAGESAMSVVPVEGRR